MYEVKYTPKWSADVSVGDRAGTAVWYRYEVEETGLVDYALRMEAAGSDYQDRELLKAAVEVRREELRAELALPDPDEVEQVGDLIMDLYTRSQEGEFVGQLRGGMLYVFDVAELLKCRVADVFPAVERLFDQERIALNGMILWDWEEIERQRQLAFKRTGHRALSQSDFGYWSCASCGKHGDDYTDPEDYPCVADTSQDTDS